MCAHWGSKRGLLCYCAAVHCVSQTVYRHGCAVWLMHMVVVLAVGCVRVFYLHVECIAFILVDALACGARLCCPLVCITDGVYT
jgi:hypothetical protein